MLFLTNCESLGMQLQLSEHFTYPNTLRSQRVRITEVLLYIYICVCTVIERTRDLIYLKFVATDFFPKIISPSAGENSGDLT